MQYIFPPASPVALPVFGEDATFPVRRVYCIAANYALHAAELGGDGREPPAFFSKPTDALVPDGGVVSYPPRTENLQHEVELVVAIGMGGANIPVETALDHVYGYAVGIDLTRRDLQAQAKAKGRPWEMSKGFDHSGPISAIVPATRTGHPVKGRIWLAVNGIVKQDGDLDQMTWNVAEVIANLSSLVKLSAGDLIFTGTPSGVSTVIRGDLLECGIDKVGLLNAKLV
ncbi:fumarylpyruvate hydrolase [Formivibrio citricus]|uniref:Fumarylpyruvate hydrolase n=1 Tax=Formivibrio citricus TaxID=83765 RepID=A0A1I5BY73_9NEIS|nr:fumarylacetoacetate hydrolase family protein [Formivibrio citricus]SFN79653.1 fumarylpyruvate hydrolase [Formivibrio citricus]